MSTINSITLICASIIGVCGLLLVPGCKNTQSPGKQVRYDKVGTSPFTTVIDEPLNRDGDVDYLFKINQLRDSRSIESDNAAVALIRMLGFVEPKGRKYYPTGRLQGLSDANMRKHGEIQELGAYLEEQGYDSQCIEDAEDSLRDASNSFERMSAPNAQLKEWIDANGAKIDIMREAASLPYYYFPYIECGDYLSYGWMDYLVYTYLRAIAILIGRSYMRYYDGDIDGAIEDIGAAYLLSIKYSRGQAPLFYGGAHTYARKSCWAATVMIASGRLSKPQVNKLQIAFRVRLYDESFELSFLCMRLEELSIIEHIMHEHKERLVKDIEDEMLKLRRDSGAATKSTIYWDEVYRRVNCKYDRLWMRVVPSRDVAAKTRARYDFSLWKGMRKRASMEENVPVDMLLDRERSMSQIYDSGRMMTVLATWYLGSANKTHEYLLYGSLAGTIVRADQVELTAAIELYRQEKGVLPEVLSDAYFYLGDDVPYDPFTQTDYRYVVRDLSGYYLYSVNDNCINDNYSDDDMGYRYHMTPAGGVVSDRWSGP